MCQPILIIKDLSSLISYEAEIIEGISFGLLCLFEILRGHLDAWSSNWRLLRGKVHSWCLVSWTFVPTLYTSPLVLLNMRGLFPWFLYIGMWWQQLNSAAWKLGVQGYLPATNQINLKQVKKSKDRRLRNKVGNMKAKAKDKKNLTGYSREHHIKEDILKVGVNSGKYYHFIYLFNSQSPSHRSIGHHIKWHHYHGNGDDYCICQVWKKRPLDKGPRNCPGWSHRNFDILQGWDAHVSVTINLSTQGHIQQQGHVQ